MPPPRRLGSEYEDRAADCILTLGWTLLGRRVKLPHGELDLVALDGDALVFIEVKQRADGMAVHSVDPRKQAHLLQAAVEFCLRFELSPNRPMRFDLVLFHGEELTHIQNAIQNDGI